jgi:serine/threonine protein kinase/tetratricopeptide (TPR) repeat protein
VSLELVVAGVARMHDNSASSSPVGVRPGGFFVINCPHCSTVNPDFAESCSRCGTPMPLGDSETIQMVDATVIATGSDFGSRYRIEALLGQGGMGRVYKAYDKDLDRTVAIKVVREGAIGESDALKRFKQELVLASKISHKNILRIHDMGDVGGLRFISMAYVEGQDLQHIIRDNPKMPLERILKFAQQIADALAAAHAEGVVHRDLKPQNLLVDKNDQIFVCDFGLAKSFEEGAIGMTRTGAFLGTPRYMSPEQVEGKPADGRADLYAFGLILYELVIGDVPFTGESTLKVMYQRIQEKPKSPKLLRPDLPNWLVKIIMRCLERNPDDRYQNAFEILADLRGGASGSGTSRAGMSRIGSGAQSVIIQIPEFANRRWVLVLAGVFALMLLALAIPPVRHLIPGFRTETGAGSGKSTAGPSISLAILPFRNASGDASLDWLGPSLADMLSTDVGQSASLRTISQDRLHQVLSDLRITPNASIDPATLRRLAEFSNADTLVSGQYARFGGQIRIDATLQDLKHDRSVPIKIEAVDEKDIPGAVDRLATSVRNNLAFSPDVIKELKASSFQPSSGSAPALRDYNQGVQLLRDGKNVEAVKALQAAVQEDPQFALAYSRLAEADSALGYDNDAEQASRKAVELSDQLAPQEKYLIQASHDRIQRDYPKAIEAYGNLAKAAPDNADVLFDLAELYENSSAYDQAREEYTKVLTLDPKRVQALLAMGRVEVDSSNPQKALEYLTRALPLTVEFGNEEVRANILQVMGVAYAALNKHEDALSNFRESLEIKRKLGLKQGIAISLRAMAISEDVLGKPDQALKDYKEALALAQELGDKAETGDIQNDIAQFYVDHGQYDQALKLFKESLQAEIDVGNLNGQGYVLNNIGNAYFFKADYQNARTYFEQALQVREKLNVPNNIADTLHNLGDTSGKMGQYDLAVEQYLRALDLRRSTGDKRGAALESSSMGILFGYQGRYGAALSSEEDALKTFRELQERGYWLAEILGLYGNALAQVGRSDDAQKSLDEAMNVARELKNQATTAKIQGYQGDNAFYRGEFKAAAALYDEALKTASHASDLDLILVSKLNVAKVAVRQGRFQSAASLLSKLSEEADSMGLKYVSVECSIYHAEALMNLKSYEPARKELESALSRSDKLGMKALLAESHYLLARDLELAGKTADAPEHYKQARKILDDIQKEAKTDSIVKRSDLSPIYAHSAG